MCWGLPWVLAFALFCGTLVWQDYRWRRVPNIAVLAMLGFLALWWTAGWYWPLEAPGAALPAQGLLAMAVSLLVFYPLWRFGAMGAGDVKALAVMAASLGLHGWLPVLVMGSLLAGAHAVAGLACRRWLGGNDLGLSRGVPYAGHLGLAAQAWWWLY